jgi:hypothetical protein
VAYRAKGELIVAKKTYKLGVDFGGVSFGKTTARISVKMTRDEIDLADADGLLCGARLSINAMATGDTKGEPLLPDVMPKLSGVADCKALNLTIDHIGFGLTFARVDLDQAGMIGMANQSGTLRLQRIGDAAHVEDAAGDDAGEGEDDKASE